MAFSLPTNADKHPARQEGAPSWTRRDDHPAGVKKTPPPATKTSIST